MHSKVIAEISVTVQITLNEKEARALGAIFGYGPDAFLKGFYKNLGRHYLEPHAKAVPELFASVQKQIGPALARVDKARKEFNRIES